MITTELTSYLRAGFSCFWLTTSEPERVKKVVYPQLSDFSLSNGDKYKVADWKCTDNAAAINPLMALASAEENTVMFLYNYHWFISNNQIVQFIQESIPVWSSKGQAIVVVSSTEKIPPELAKDFTMVDLPMPMADDIEQIIHKIAPSEKYEPKGDELAAVKRVSKGLTAREMENVYALSLVKHKKLDVGLINEFRAQTIRKSGFAEVLPPTVTFKDVIGYEEFKKQFMESVHKPDSKGIAAIGPAGTGKTSLAKAMGAESGKLTVMVNLGAFQSKFQGESFQNVKNFIKMITALGDCLLIFDEFEKQFAGTSGAGELDSGVKKGMGSLWLDFFQNRPPNVYIVSTFNSFVGVDPEYLRAGRYDTSPFFIDLPNEKVKAKILKHYMEKFGLDPKQKVPTMKDWSGAEIESLCHNANMRGISLMEASQLILPLAATKKEEIDALRNWAKGRTIDAEKMPEFKTTGKRKLEI